MLDQIIWESVIGERSPGDENLAGIRIISIKILDRVAVKDVTNGR